MNYSSAAASRRIKELNGGLDNQDTSNFEDQYLMENATGDVSLVSQANELIPRGTLTFNIKKDNNAIPAPVGDILISMFRGITPPANIGGEVTMQESPYADFIEQSKTTPFLLRFPQIRTNNVNQLSRLITYARKTLFGSEYSDSITPSVFSSAKNYNANQLDKVPFEFIVDGYSSLNFSLINAADLTLTFEVYEFSNNAQAMDYAQRNGLFRKLN